MNDFGIRRDEAEAGRKLNCIVNFGDGVFAIVITLLVLDIRVTNIPPSVVPQELPSWILALSPTFLSYVISFLTIADYWQAHYSVFRPIRIYDRTLLWLNFLFLRRSRFWPSLPRCWAGTTRSNSQC